MEQNPYEAPKEVGPPPTIKAGMTLGALLLLAIPDGCICGGITCASAGIVTDSLAHESGAYFAGRFLFAVPLGLFVCVLIPLLAVLLFRKRGKAP